MDGTSVSHFRSVGAPEDAAAPLIRLTEPVYDDGVGAPRSSPADARQVAYQVFTQGDVDMPNAAGLSALWILWGQFLDHDLDLMPEQHGATAEMMKFDPPFTIIRSAYAPGTSTDGVAREQMNVITPLIDASNVYGSDADRQHALRTFDGGRLKAAAGPDGTDLLPDSNAVFNDGGTAVAAGDIRAQENPGLAAIHSVFVNEHNHWADRFATEHPEWTDEEIFQNAKVVIEMLVQKITYEEFLPVLLGTELPTYQGYDPNVDPQVSNEFASAAFRFGHTAIPDGFTFVSERGQPAAAAVSLFETFDNPAALRENGLPSLVRGLLEARAQELDATVVDSLNYLLFTPDGGLTGFSLPERNILRGRDHGIDCYLAVREALVGDVDAEGLVGSTDFSIITTNPALQAKLAAVYGTVDQVDLWVGGLAEDHAPGVTIGRTFQAILVDQFTRARDADPLFYLDRPVADPDLHAEILATRFSDVLTRSAGIDHVQGDALVASNRIGGGDRADHLWGGADRDLLIGFAGADWLHGNDADDDLFGDTGSDTLRGGAGNDSLDGGTDADRLDGGAGNDTLSGGAGDDWLHGYDGDDVLDGETGADTLRGGAGNDSLDGGDDADRLDGGAGTDSLSGGAGDDWLHGYDGDDVLDGGSGADTLRGGAGNDRLDGGDGYDRLFGGSGADIFVIAPGQGTDIIVDFTAQLDRIGLADGLLFDDLSLTVAGGTTTLRQGGETLAILVNVSGFDSDDVMLV